MKAGLFLASAPVVRVTDTRMIPTDNPKWYAIFFTFVLTKQLLSTGKMQSQSLPRFLIFHSNNRR
jgi:hypothetical protein